MNPIPLALAKEGTSYFQNTAVGTTAVAVVAAAANLNGVIISNAYCLSITAGQGAALLTATSAPVSIITAGNGFLLYSQFQLTTSGAINPLMLPYPVFIPPGRGIYAIAGAAATGNIGASYTVL